MPNSDNLTERGRIQFGVFLVSDAIPANNAVIRIMHHGESEVVEQLVTDVSGQTLSIELPAPPEEFSLVFPSAEKPYSEYDANITLNGFEPELIKGIQILPGTSAYQAVYMRPLTGAVQTEVIEIETHTLWGNFPPKISESEIKELPPATGYVVLPEPVVPEFIIVHDGRPDDASAPNYWVPFTDYIKNVASSEIYATWPHETITANVLAILSFTLNRVYTEWYRGQGFDFTITSSTAFDQAFSYGRNIFDEISTVVDGIFTTFITRSGARQPLFAQYCDGRTVSCPGWLTQWGSKDLGKRGYMAIDILKNFYGHDIFLMQAEQVAGVPISFPGKILQMGSTGDPVRTIQSQLNAISDHYPAISKVRVDGIYGDETRRAVEIFQNVFRLPSDGMVNFATWFRISHIFTAVTNLAALI